MQFTNKHCGKRAILHHAACVHWLSVKSGVFKLLSLKNKKNRGESVSSLNRTNTSISGLISKYFQSCLFPEFGEVFFY